MSLYCSTSRRSSLNISCQRLNKHSGTSSLYRASSRFPFLSRQAISSASRGVIVLLIRRLIALRNVPEDCMSSPQLAVCSNQLLFGSS